jgi:hypothetical protein
MLDVTWTGIEGEAGVGRKQGAGSRKQGAGSREQEAGSREQGAGSREQEAGSRCGGVFLNITDIIRDYYRVLMVFNLGHLYYLFIELIRKICLYNR